MCKAYKGWRSSLAAYDAELAQIKVIVAKDGLLEAAVGYSAGRDFHVYITAGKHPTGEVEGQKLFPILLGAQGDIGAGNRREKGDGPIGQEHQELQVSCPSPQLSS